MTRDERLKLREALLYLADCMIVMDTIERQHDCNDCGKKLRCKYVPDAGAPVRINCPLWEE